ncbi:protein hu-li tai shao isoform X6 [Halyomorpha halys]|uniref:protein hu-li tai shao isoform X6 n=1 Tax=Halyomorpha halys TaxID=286706 RepID=UPI0006D4E2CE|nr:protein hu-li tai shao isoform X6 [Halyomorpha halys]
MTLQATEDPKPEEMTESEQVPATNGLPEEVEEDEKTKMRPPDIDADMREMERRKRVEMIMSSRLFREELERIIESQMKEGGGPAGLLQQIQDMVGGASRLQANIFRGSNCVLPINDIRGIEAMGYAKGEKVLRCKLASVFRLMDLYGWSNGIHNLITGRLAQDNEEFIVNPHGLMYHEVTASSLIKVDMQGNVIEQGTTNFTVNAVAFQLHAALHAARPDIKCVIHVRNPPVLAISSLKCGILPISAESAVIGEVSHHQYLGSAAEPEEREKIARSLGPINKVLLLTNHGALCCGETIEEAFFHVYNTVLACETQVKLMPLGVDNLITLSDEGRKSIYDSARKAPPNDKKWRVGGLEFEALMRMLDNAGFRTGYIYRSPLVKNEPPKPRNDVEVPPAVSSLGYLLEEEEMYKQGNWKKGGVNRSDRNRWLNSPNVYQKVEILETGTPDPKKITKWVDANSADEWVTDGSPGHTSTPVKIDAALQFVPKNTNPKEFKKLQQQIKENRRADKITSGPQSHILEGVTWEEAKKLQDANISMTGDQVILVGAASKGIIQRGFQHNATVYKSPYAKNPFDSVSEQELEEYKNVVTRKQKGDYYEDTEQSESEALSSSAALSSAALIKSEQEETSEPRVLRIETKTAPAPSQAEVVLSDDDFPDPHVERSKSHRYPPVQVPDVKRSSSADRAISKGENTYNGDHSDAHQSTFSQSSKEVSGSPTKDLSTEDSPKKDKKKKKGLRTPSFLKKKSKKKAVES